MRAVLITFAVASLATSALAAPDPLPGLPAAVRFGASLAQTQAAAAPVCAKLTLRRIDPPFLNVIKDRQMQIDCDGLVFQGQPRHVEFVIGDDRLGMIWLMVRPEDEAAVMSTLTTTYGPPQRTNAKYSIFPGHRVAYRHDRSEILFYADERTGDVTPNFQPSAPK